MLLIKTAAFVTRTHQDDCLSDVKVGKGYLKVFAGTKEVIKVPVRNSIVHLYAMLWHLLLLC